MKKETTPQKKKAAAGLALVHPNAAGTRIGDTFHAGAIPEGRGEVQVRTFGAMSCDFIAIVELGTRIFERPNLHNATIFSLS